MQRKPRDFAFERSVPAQIEATRRLGGTGRLAMVRDLNNAVRKLMAAKVVEEHPDWSADEVRREVLRRVLRAWATRLGVTEELALAMKKAA